MAEQPWDFSQSEQKAYAASHRQFEAEEEVRVAYKAFAIAQEAYAIRLKEVIESLRAMSVPVTVCLELAKGATDVASLRRDRDIAEGEKVAAEQRCWRAAADRKDTLALIGWSERREFAEARGEVRHEFSQPIGGRA